MIQDFQHCRWYGWQPRNRPLPHKLLCRVWSLFLKLYGYR